MRIIYTLLCLIILPGIILTWKETMATALGQIDVYIPFFFGIGVYIILMGIKIGSFNHNFKWFQVFSHELTHVIFSILTFNKIHGFKATSHRGGYIEYQGRTNMLIILSPYCIPIFTLLLTIIAAIFGVRQNQYMIGAIGFTYMFHLHTFLVQTKGHQPDLRIYGRIPSYIFILLINLVMTGMIIGSITDGLMAFRNFSVSAWNYTYTTIVHVWGTVFA